jgi:heme-degrading monooxygenase HmoA
MILEIAHIGVKPGMEAEFETAVAKGKPLFAGSKGCHSMQVRRSIEVPGRYWLFVEWETLEDHTVGFRGSQVFTEWRALITHCLETPPVVEHGAEAIRII